MRIVLLLLCLLVFACESSDSPRGKLKQLEKNWREQEASGKPVDRGQALLLARSAEFYARQNPEDPEAPRYALLAGKLFDDLGRHGEALLACEIVRFKHPDSPEAADATLLFAQVLHLDIHDAHRAELAYQEFLTRWPSHPQARLAEEALAFFRTPSEQLHPDSLKRNP